MPMETYHDPKSSLGPWPEAGAVWLSDQGVASWCVSRPDDLAYMQLICWMEAMPYCWSGMFKHLKKVTIAVNLLVAGGTLTAGVKPPGQLFLPLSLDKALVAAVKQKRIVFIDFCTAWCGACKKLDEDTWSDSRVIEQLRKSTIPIKLDADKEQMIRDRYKVQAYPTLLFLNADGSVLASIIGYQIPARFLQTLQGVMANKSARTGSQKLVDGDR